MWLLFSILSALFASIMTITIKIGLKDFNPILSLTIRTLFVFVFSLVLILITKILKLKIAESINIEQVFKGKNIFWLIIVSLATFFTWLFYFLALKDGKAVKVMAIDKLSVVLIVIFSVIFLNQKVTIKLIIGLILMIISIFCLI